MEPIEQKLRFGELRAILRYVRLFRGQRFVVAVDGAILDTDGLTDLLLDLAVLQSLNIHVVLVHGAGQQTQRLAETRDVTLSSTDGNGITDAPTLDTSIEAITRISNQLLEHATRSNVRVAIGNVLVAHPAGIVKGVDQQLTGVIDRVDTDSLEAFLKEGLLPVIPPLGHDRQGQTLRLNSDSVATEVALALGAAKILFVTKTPVCSPSGERVRQLSVGQARGRSLDADSELSPLVLSKLKQAARACTEGVARVHLVNGNERDGLLAELFSNEGTGTMVYADAYQEIRSATLADVPPMVVMMHQSIHDEDLLPRTAEDVIDQLNDYSVIEVDGTIVGCVALHTYQDHRSVELACLFIKRNHENHGYGRRLVEFAARRAIELEYDTIFLLTTGATSFFQRVGGFQLGDETDLPPKRRAALQASARVSQVLCRSTRAEAHPGE